MPRLRPGKEQRPRRRPRAPSLDAAHQFTLSQVALNDLIMVFAFAPIVGLLLGLSAITVPWDTLVLSVILYIVVPVIIAQLALGHWRCHPETTSGSADAFESQPLSRGSEVDTLEAGGGGFGQCLVERPVHRRVFQCLFIGKPCHQGRRSCFSRILSRNATGLARRI